MTSDFLFTSESVTEGHPDKVCDQISDAILDACLEQDPLSRVAVEALAKDSTVVLAGEISSRAEVDYHAVVRQVVREIGYSDPDEAFYPDGLHIIELLTAQAEEISDAVFDHTAGSPQGGQAVDSGASGHASHASGHPGLSAVRGAGDQGMMFGYATAETPELMPLPIHLAHRIAEGLAADRRSGISWLRPDGKTQVTVAYRDGAPVGVTTVLVSAQHKRDVHKQRVEEYVRDALVPRVLGEWYRDGIEMIVNPSGSFVEGGPSVDTGLTGRKIIVDTYGGMGRHGGGAFSGKDPSKVDRSGAYFARYVARQIVRAGLARKAEVQVSYGIGLAEPLSLYVNTFGTGDDAGALDFARSFSFEPADIISRLDLQRPIYRQTAAYGHFGKPDLPWEIDSIPQD